MFWLIAGFGCAGVGAALALAVSVEIGVVLVVLGAGGLGVGVGLIWPSGTDIFKGLGAPASVEAEPGQLDDKEQRLGELISQRCDQVWEGIRDGRYVKREDGQVTDVDGGAIFNEIRDVVREVAALYHADSADAVREARVGDIAFAVRSATGDFLQLARQIPYVDPAGWSIREVMTRLEQVQKVRKLYNKLSSYQHYIKGATIAARLALGASPASIATWYVGGEAAKRVTGKVLTSYAEARLKELLESMVALVYLQVARMYDPRGAYRSAEWAALVEALRIHATIPGSDHNRKLLLDRVLGAQIPDEFATIALLSALAAHREPDSRTIPPVDFAPLLPEQRQAIADRLRDALADVKGLDTPAAREMIEDLERRLKCRIEVEAIRSGSSDGARANNGMRSAKTFLRRFLRRGWRSGRRALSRSENSP